MVFKLIEVQARGITIKWVDGRYHWQSSIGNGIADSWQAAWQAARAA